MSFQRNTIILFIAIFFMTNMAISGMGFMQYILENDDFAEHLGRRLINYIKIMNSLIVTSDCVFILMFVSNICKMVGNNDSYNRPVDFESLAQMV